MLFFFLRDGFFDDKLRQVRLLRLTMLLRHGRCPKWQAHLVHRTTDGGHESGTQCDVGGMGHVEHHAQTTLDTCHVVGCELTDLVAQRRFVHVQLTDQVCQLTRVDLHRARSGAESVRRTGLVTIVFILLA